MRFFTRRLHREEDGVTLVIVVLCLVAMIGMLVLVVDVGGLLWKRRTMVNGADAAALAAAKTCASQPDTSIPETQSDSYAAVNVPGLVPANGGIVTDPNCDSGESGYVTVQYTSAQKLFFSGIFGASSGNVTTAATAAWGPLGGGSTVPIVVEEGTLQGPCEIPDPDFDPDTDPPKTCPLWYNNNDLGNADWGFMNLDQWGVAGNTNCSNAGSSDRADWIQNDYPNPLYLNGDPPGSTPTYVCVDTGHTTRDWNDLVARMQANPFLLFPVNDCSGQLDKTGTVAPCPATPDKYDIIGFVKLSLINVLKGNDNTTTDGTPCAIDCGGVAMQQGDCGSTGVNLGTAGAGAYGLGGWSVDTIATGSCGAPKAPDTIANLNITKKVGTVTTTYVQCSAPGLGCDYIYNSATHHIDWYNALTRPGAENYKTKFNWTINAVAPTPGICHPHLSDPNAICLQMQYLGFDTGGNVVGVGELFGTFGYVLCDRNLATCPDQRT
jgi:Putative Flp pilus-assembly TadE/G-like